MPHSHAAVPVLVAAGFMIHSKSFAKCSVAADLAGEFSIHSLAVRLGHVPMICVMGRICGTTWKSSWRKRHSAQKRRLKLRSLIPAINAMRSEEHTSELQSRLHL